MELGIRERPSTANVDDTLARLIREYSKLAPDELPLTRLAARCGDPAARDRLRTWARDPARAVNDRVAAIAALAEVPARDAGIECLGLVLADGPEAVRLAALAAWSRTGTTAEAGTLIADYPQLPAAIRARLRSSLMSRKAWARALLRAVDAGRVSAKDFAPEELFTVAAHGDADLDALVRKHWGNVRGATPGEKLAEVRRLNNDLRAGTGDAKAGRALFTKHCAACHRLNGEGGSVGPELTHANRADRDFLLVSLVDPSAVIRKEYLSYTAETRDGRLVTGVVTAQTAATVTLTNAKAEPTTLKRDEIASLRESAVSLMPEGLLTALKPQELRDLFGYLQTLAPKP
jgi:putative heme-binding domain-containing protein